MAEAAGHKFGQFVGESCEAALEPILQAFADKHGLYLDKKGKRACEERRLRPVDRPLRVPHNLDYVLERGGTPGEDRDTGRLHQERLEAVHEALEEQGPGDHRSRPPDRQKHHFSAPMIGCILVGDYSAPSLEQLLGIGFKVLYLDYDSVKEAFRTVGIDAHFDEKTPDSVHVARKQQWDALSSADQAKVWETLVELNRRNLENFMLHLERAVKHRSMPSESFPCTVLPWSASRSARPSPLSRAMTRRPPTAPS